MGQEGEEDMRYLGGYSIVVGSGWTKGELRGREGVGAEATLKSVSEMLRRHGKCVSTYFIDNLMSDIIFIIVYVRERDDKWEEQPTKHQYISWRGQWIIANYIVYGCPATAGIHSRETRETQKFTREEV